MLYALLQLFNFMFSVLCSDLKVFKYLFFSKTSATCGHFSSTVLYNIHVKLHYYCSTHNASSDFLRFMRMIRCVCWSLSAVVCG